MKTNTLDGLFGIDMYDSDHKLAPIPNVAMPKDRSFIAIISSDAPILDKDDTSARYCKAIIENNVTQNSNRQPFSPL